MITALTIWFIGYWYSFGFFATEAGEKPDVFVRLKIFMTWPVLLGAAHSSNLSKESTDDGIEESPRTIPLTED